MEEQTKIFITLILIIGIIVGILCVFAPRNSDTIYEEILLLDAKVQEISSISAEADTLYIEAGYSYEDEDWDGVERNCRLARNKYSTHAQELREFKVSIGEGELLDLKKEMLEQNIIMDNSLFEACEHFESASRYYKKYYLPSTPAGDNSFEMGGGEIQMMNEKILAHDQAVERYNTILAEYTIKLRESLE